VKKRWLAHDPTSILAHLQRDDDLGPFNGVPALRTASDAVQQPVFHHVPQRGAGRAFDELSQEKRHVVVRQCIGVRVRVQGRQETTSHFLAGAISGIEQAVDPLSIELVVVRRRGLEDTVGNEQDAITWRHREAVPSECRREADSNRNVDEGRAAHGRRPITDTASPWPATSARQTRDINPDPHFDR